MTFEVLAIVGAISALIGSIVLAFSLTSIFSEISNAIGFLNISAESIARGGDRFIFDGIQERIERARKKSFVPTIIGLVLLVTSFICHSITVGMNKIDSINTKTQVRNIESQFNDLKSTVEEKYEENKDSIDNLKESGNEQQFRLDSAIERIKEIERQITLIQHKESKKK